MCLCIQDCCTEVLHVQIELPYYHVNRIIQQANYIQIITLSLIAQELLVPLLSNSPHLFILGQNIRHWSSRCDTKLINLLMALGIMELDVLKVRRLPERRHIPVQLPHPAMNSRIPGANIPYITLEMLHIHGVEADNRREEPDIRLCDRGAKVKGGIGIGALRSGEVRLDTVEGGEEGCYGAVVGFLRGCEAGFVDAVVDVVVGPVVCGFDLGTEGWWVEVDFFVLVWEEVVEFVVEHADDFGALFYHQYTLFIVVVFGMNRWV